MAKTDLYLALLALFVIVAAVAGAKDALASPPAQNKNAFYSELSSQQRPAKRRIRPRLRVTPRQPSAWTYPRPGTYSWPGPNAVRECRSWLVQEARISGTVIVPQMQCWWVPN